MIDYNEEQKIAVDIENDMENKSKLNDIYGPKDTFIFIYLGVFTFLILFFVFQYFATIDDGINTNFKYIFCNSGSDNDNAGDTSDYSTTNSANFNKSL